MSLFSLYKPGQGKWTRICTAVGAGLLTLAMIYWIVGELQGIHSEHRGTIQAIVGLGILLIVAGVLWWLLNKPRIVEFMIATEAEMRKVNWPTRREVIGSTWVVICGTFLMASLIFVLDIFFAELFINLRILDADVSVLRALFQG
ncbi:MAG: preprotein translocase subunit SecE [Phycisphaeraceae bacterium]